MVSMKVHVRGCRMGGGVLGRDIHLGFTQSQEECEGQNKFDIKRSRGGMWYQFGPEKEVMLGGVVLGRGNIGVGYTHRHHSVSRRMGGAE